MYIHNCRHINKYVVRMRISMGMKNHKKSLEVKVGTFKNELPL